MISSGGVGRRFLRCPRKKWTQRRTARQSWLDLLDQSAQRLDDLGVAAPNPFDLERFLGQLMQLRGREILLTPISIRAHSATVCGYCLRLVDRDHVFYTHSR